MKELSKQFKVGAVISYVTIAFNIISGLIYTPWLLKEIGDVDYGLYTLATSLINIFLLDFGIGSAMTRYVSRYIAQGDKEAVNRFVGFVFRLFFIIDLIIFVVLTVVYQFVGNIYVELSVYELDRFKVVYVIVAIYSLIQFPMTNFDGILYANERFIVIKMCELLQKVVTIAIMIVVLLNDGGLYGLVLVNSGVALAISFFKAVYVRKKTDIKIKYSKMSKDLVKEVICFSVWATVVSIMLRWFYNVMPSILAAVSGTMSITYFSFASLLEGYIFLIGNAFNGFFISKVTRLCLNNENKKIMELMVLIGKMQLIIIGLVVMGFVCVGDLFVSELWLGTEYYSVYIGAIILMSASLFSVPEQVADTVVTVQNKLKNKAIVYIVGGTTNVLLAIWLGSKMGFLGGCISIFIANMIIYFLMNYVYWKELHINVVSFWKKVYWPFFPCQILVTVICRLVYSCVHIYGMMGFVVKGVIFVTLYAFFAYYVVLRKEREKICLLLKKES